MLDVLADPILPVFAIAALGYGLGRAGLADMSEARAVNRFAMTVPLPVLVFGLIASAPIERFQPGALAAYALVEGLFFAGGYRLARRVLGRAPDEAVLLAFCGIFANNAFFVLPIALFLHGPDNVIGITQVITLDSTVTFAGSIMALQLIASGRVGPAVVARTMVRSPIIVAIVVGLLVAALGIPLPSSVDTFVFFTGAAAAPLGLFALGVVLSGTVFGRDPAVLVFSTIKLVCFPAAIAAAIWLVGGAEGARFVLASAGPSGTMAFSLALLYGVRTEAIAQIVLATSVLSLPLLAALA
ncbi:MAG: AEC family transporter [Pseudomonadota bacterium]